MSSAGSPPGEACRHTATPALLLRVCVVVWPHDHWCCTQQEPVLVAAWTHGRQPHRRGEHAVETAQQVFQYLVVDGHQRGRAPIGFVAYQQTRCPFRTKMMIHSVKSHNIGPSDSSHWTLSTISCEPSVRPKQSRVNGSSSMVMGRSLQQPGLCTRSSFAMVTQSPTRPPNLRPMRSVVSRSTKLWVDPEPSSVVDDDVKLYGAPCAGVNAGECVDGDHGRVGVVRRCVVVFCHLNAEQLFAHLLMPDCEEFIAMETLPILVALGHLGRGQPLDGRCGLDHRW
jgi:hypothetical protein